MDPPPSSALSLFILVYFITSSAQDNSIVAVPFILYLVRFCSPKPCKQQYTVLILQSAKSLRIGTRAPVGHRRNGLWSFPVLSSMQFEVRVVRLLTQKLTLQDLSQIAATAEAASGDASKARQEVYETHY